MAHTFNFRAKRQVQFLGQLGAFGATTPPKLAIGAKGAAVLTLQKALNYLGYGAVLAGAKDMTGRVVDQAAWAAYQSAGGSTPWIDGVFGTKTFAAVIAFQEGAMCSAVGGCGTGIVDAATWAALQSRSAINAAEMALISSGGAPQQGPPLAPPPPSSMQPVVQTSYPTTTPYITTTLTPMPSTYSVIPAAGMSTTAKIALGVGAVAVAALGYVTLKRRRGLAGLRRRR